MALKKSEKAGKKGVFKRGANCLDMRPFPAFLPFSTAVTIVYCPALSLSMQSLLLFIATCSFLVPCVFFITQSDVCPSALPSMCAIAEYLNCTIVSFRKPSLFSPESGILECPPFPLFSLFYCLFPPYRYCKASQVIVFFRFLSYIPLFFLRPFPPSNASSNGTVFL